MFPQLNLSVTGSACGPLGMWLYVFITPIFVLWFWSPLGKGWQNRPSSGGWICVVTVAWYVEIDYKGRDKYLLCTYFPSPALSFSLLPPSPFFFPRSSWTLASCQQVQNKMKTLKCVCKYIGEDWLMLCSLCDLYWDLWGLIWLGSLVYFYFMLFCLWVLWPTAEH